MQKSSKRGRPKGSNGPNPLGLMSLTIGDPSQGTSRSGSQYSKHETLEITQDEFYEIKSKREAERIQQEKDVKAEKFERALAAVISKELNIRQASLQFNVNRITLTAHAVAAAAGKEAPKLGRPPVMTEEQRKDVIEIVKDRDLHKNSIKDCDFTEFIVQQLDEIHGKGGGVI